MSKTLPMIYIYSALGKHIYIYIVEGFPGSFYRYVCDYIYIYTYIYTAYLKSFAANLHSTGPININTLSAKYLGLKFSWKTSNIGMEELLYL